METKREPRVGDFYRYDLRGLAEALQKPADIVEVEVDGKKRQAVLLPEGLQLVDCWLGNEDGTVQAVISMNEEDGTWASSRVIAGECHERAHSKPTFAEAVAALEEEPDD